MLSSTFLRGLLAGGLFVLLLAGSAAAQTDANRAAATGGKTTELLTSGWRFRQVGKANWAPATVPGGVHTDLLAAKQIEDPLYRDNETKLQWIGKVDWEYETTFAVTPATLQRANLELAFKGLDADVTLNDAAILHSDNMFREWRVNVKPQLRAGPNRLHIRFRSPLNEVAGLPAKYGYNLFAINDEQAMGIVGDQGPVLSPYTRKAPYQYGWDWGPRFVTSGVWQPVQLEAWDDAKLTDFHVVQRQLSAQQALLGLEVEYEGTASAAGREATLVIETTGPDGKASASRIEQKVTLQPNRPTLTAELRLNNPQRWYPAGCGAQALYSFTAQLLQNGRPVDEAKTRTGLRTLQLRREHDQYGKSFEFVVNGIPVFAKGANWIPADIFPTRVTNGRYHQLLQAAKDANMNRLRVWGGGIYENQYFYDTCDELGLLVWQDFLFACSFYPGNQEFVDKVQAEATYQVRRRRDHPSIAIWVGNNENEVAWQDWGVPQKMGAHKNEVWANYLKLYRDRLPAVLRAEDPGRPYWSSSPSADFEDVAGSQTNGDMHYWQVWGGTAPIADYEKQVPRFMSEYGFQSFPELKSVQQFTAAGDRAILSPVMRQHQRSSVGNPRLKEYLLRDYKEPKDFESFLYVSQVLQAQAIKLSAEYPRRNRPRTMGSMYWQLDDCWGVASWSSIDYYGRWKALQYYAKRFYSDVLVSPHAEGDQVRIYVVSDQTSALPGKLQVRLLDFNGRAFFAQTTALQIEPLTSKAYVSIPRAKLLGKQNPRKVVLSCQVQQANGQVLSANNYYFAIPKALALPRPSIRADWQQTTDSTFQVTLQSPTLAREVNLTLTEKDGFFADNYFDLLPGEKKELTFKSRDSISLAELRRQLVVRSLVDAF